MPENEHKSRLFCTTGKGSFYRSSSPKYKYIQDPCEFVDNNYKHEYSQYLIPYETMCLDVIPVWGLYSGQRIALKYDWDTVQVSVNEMEQKAEVMSLKPGTSPEQFVRFAMEFIHSGSRATNSDTSVCSTKQRMYRPASLVILCLRSAVTHITDMRPDSLQASLPREVHGHFCGSAHVTVNLNIWPTHCKRSRCTRLSGRTGMVIGEFTWIVRYALKLDCHTNIRLFRNFLPLESIDVLAEHDVIDCVIISCNTSMCNGTSQANSRDKNYVLTRVGPTEYEISPKQVLVVSLTGRIVQEIQISLTKSLCDLDEAIRHVFRLGKSTFLAVKQPNTMKFFHQTGKLIRSQTDEHKIKTLIENKRRNFPSNGTTGIPITRLYKDSPVYIRSLRSLGFYSGCYVEVFEVTGPTIPVMLFGDLIEPRALDVNRTWNIGQFLYYLQIASGRDESFTSIDYVTFNENKNVGDVLNKMGSLWWKVKKTANPPTRLEYLKIRV